MPDSSRAAQEAAVRDLRELHHDAEGADRPRAALLLGLAIADLAAQLPDTDPRVPELAREGLARLDESDATTADVARSRESLRRLRSSRKPRETSAAPPPAAGDPDGIPVETLRLGGGDMSWNVDWATLRSATEEGREVMDALRFMQPSLPGPLQQFMAGGFDVFGAVDAGQWTPESDWALAGLTQLAETTGVGRETLPFLQGFSLFIRLRRAMSAGAGKDHPDWPSTAEIDRVVAALESQPDLVHGLGAPFSDFTGMSRFLAASLLMAPVWADIRSGAGTRDWAWFDSTVRRLERAREHMNEVPPALAGGLQPACDRIDTTIAALKRAMGEAGGAAPVATGPPARPVPGPAAETPAGPAADTSPPEAVPSFPAGAATDQEDPPSLSDAPLGQFSWEKLKGLRVLGKSLPASPVFSALQAMTHWGEVTFFQRWTPEQDQVLEALQQTADQLAAEREPEQADLIIVRAALAFGRALRWHQRSDSPQAHEDASAAELAAAATDIEALLDVLPRAAGFSPGIPLEDFAGLLHVQAGIALRSLADLPDPALVGPYEPADQRRARLLARSRDHLAKLPANLADRFPVIRDMTVVARMAGDAAELGDDAERIADVYSELFDPNAGGLAKARAAAGRARQTNDLADIAAAIDEVRAVRRGLPPGHPQHSHVLVLLAELLSRHARLTGNPHYLADGIDASIEAIRAALPEEPAAPGTGASAPLPPLPAPHRSAVRAAAEHLISLLGLNLAQDQRSGACHQIEPVLSAALAATGPDDWPLRVPLTVGIGAARSVCADAPPNEELRQRGRQSIEDAERMLPAAEPADPWFDAAWTVFRWATIEAGTGHDVHGAAVALRLIGQMEGVLAGDQEFAERVAGRYGDADGTLGLQSLQQTRERLLSVQEAGSRPVASEVAAAAESGPPGTPIPAAAPAEDLGQLARRGLDRLASVLGAAQLGGHHRPHLQDVPSAAQTLRTAAADLHAALAARLADSDLRHQIDGALGRCLAELYWLGEADPPAGDQNAAAEPDAALTATLGHAIEHLNRCLATSEHALPSLERADLLDVLARCYRQLAIRLGSADARGHAERTARAVLRELARCTLVADDTERALDVAARATETVARTVGWCLADDRYRAAMEVAEAGRGLVLASVVLAGQVEQVLRGAGKLDVADAWRDGGAAGRLAGLNALWDTGRSGDLLRNPMLDRTSFALGGTAFDAIVYLVPSTPAGDAGPGAAVPPGAAPGHALLLRPIIGQIEVLDLPGLVTGTGTPVAAYVAALGTALATFDPAAPPPDGFRGTPHGQQWAGALEKLGAWTYDRILGPLIEHVHGWALDHKPHLALIPLGELAAIPYAAAWTDDPALPGTRRYAIHDAVLSYAASARLLTEVARRPRQPLTERVVLTTDPDGVFPYTRRTAMALADRQYPQAEVYGRKPARNGLPTSAALLAALPREDAPGASLLHLCTHGTTTPTARLQTADGWLLLTRILDQARNRPPDAAGGLIITNACLTDTAHTHLDESLTLATAFLAAGATAVIGTRWPIDDDTAAVLSFRLHYHLQAGRSPAEALGLAQLDLLAHEPDMRLGLHPHLAAIPGARLAHPASWAGYVHHGI